MREAAGRDLIARQYVTRYRRRVLRIGLPALEGALSRGESGMWPTVFAYMAVFRRLSRTAMWRAYTEPKPPAACRKRPPPSAPALESAGDEAARIALLMDFDRHLKARASTPAPRPI